MKIIAVSYWLSGGLASALVLVATGCASPAKSTSMVPSAFAVQKRHPHSVTVRADGGQDTDPMLDSKISTADFLAALTTALAGSGVFASVHHSGRSAYDLELTLKQVRPSYSGINVVMDMTSRWRLVDFGKRQVVGDEFVREVMHSLVCHPSGRLTGLPLAWLAWHWRSSALQVGRVRSLMADMDAPTVRAGSRHEPGASRERAGQFPPTHWTLVLGAGRGNSADAREAFGKLYEAYRPALLAFLRRDGANDDEAREMVQGFFASLLETNSLGQIRRTGRFRCWLLTCLKHYLADRRDRQEAQKRGGGEVPAPLGEDTEAGEVDPPHPGRTPEEEFDRQFALRFLDLVMARLEREYTARGKTRQFQYLQPWLLDKKGGMSHADLGSQLGLSEAAVNSEVSRLRKRYRLVFDEELLNLVGGPRELAEEKRFLFAAVTR